MADPPWDLPSSPEACYHGCGGASGSWEEFVRRTPDGAYGTRPAVETSTAHYQTESKYYIISIARGKKFGTLFM